MRLLLRLGVLIPVAVPAGRVAAGEATVEAVREAVARREARTRTVRFEWTETTRVRKAHLTTLVERDRRDGFRLDEVTEKHLETRKRPVEPVDGFVAHEQRGVFLVDGERRRYETRGTTPHGDDALVPIDRVGTLDGEVVRTFDNSRTTIRVPTGSVSAVSPRQRMLLAVHVPLALRLAVRPAEAGFAPSDTDEWSLDDETVAIDGRDCLVLRRTGRGFDEEYALDPDRGYTVVRRTKLRRGARSDLLECTYERDEAGVWLPSKWTETKYQPDGTAYRIVEGKVRRRAVGGDVPAKQFVVAFPAGTFVSDNRRDAENYDRGWRAAYYLVKRDGTKFHVPSGTNRTYEDWQKEAEAD